jgi:hypothetical protein
VAEIQSAEVEAAYVDLGDMQLLPVQNIPGRTDVGRGYTLLIANAELARPDDQVCCSPLDGLPGPPVRDELGTPQSGACLSLASELLKSDSNITIA